MTDEKKNLGEDLKEQARLDALVAHDPRTDVVALGQLEDLEKLDQPTPNTSETSTKEASVASGDSLTLSKNKVVMIKKIAQSLRDSAGQLVELLSMVDEDEVRIKAGQTEEVKKELLSMEVGAGEGAAVASARDYSEPKGNVIEGLFDGEKMVGPDGKTYVVPVNYASKSRLVEGDSLKLIITDSGTFIYKQINPIERRRLVGTLDEGDNGEYYVMAEDRRWRVLPASITYYKGEIGDEVVILIPKVGISRWAAVENVVRH